MSVLDGPRRELRRVSVAGRIHSCQLDGEELVRDDGRRIREVEAHYVAPVEPRTIVCVHLNFRSRAVEFGRDLEQGHPTYFLKPSSSANAHRGTVVRPDDCQLLNYEG